MKESQTPNVFEVIDFCKELDLEAELVGKWIWISFDGKPDRELRRTLKDFGLLMARLLQRFGNHPPNRILHIEDR